MISYSDLIHANLEPLSEAVAKWRNLPGEFHQVGTNFKNQVKSPLDNSDWEGEAASAARRLFGKVMTQFGEAADEAEDVHGLLKSFHNQFQEYQNKLKEYKNNVEADKNLHIDGSGRVSYRAADPESLSAEESATQAKNYTEVVSTYNQRINDVLTAATTADELLEFALRLDHNGRKKGFSSDGFSSIRETRAGHAQALKDLKTATELAESPGRLSPTQLNKMNSIFSRHEGDPFFTQKFVTDVGVKGILGFWNRVANTTQKGGERTKALEKLQKSLGFTLATASHADSGNSALDKKMEKWNREMIRQGSHRLTVVDLESGRMEKGPYGFQVMSSLMQNGKFDAEFLTTYGKGYGRGENHVPGLIEFDKEAAKKGNLKEFWIGDGLPPMLNLGKGGDHGLDPMAGYMEALGHNPEAGQEVFYQKGWSEGDTNKPNPNLKYLLEERDWPNGNELASSERGKGYDELGHALEAAAMGHPYDQPELGLNRDRDSGNVMSQVVTVVGKDPGFLDDKMGLGNSLAKMGAAYIDDIDHSLFNPDSDVWQRTRDSAFHHDDPNGGHIVLGGEESSAFLRTVGSSETGYEILSSAQQRFTTGAMLEHPKPNDELAVIFESGATVQGILNENRAQDIESQIADIIEAKERAETAESEWTKAGISGGLGIGVGLAVAPFGGPGASAAAAVAVPLVIETGASLLDAGAGQAVDQGMSRELKEMEGELEKEGIASKEEFNSLGRARAMHAMNVYASLHPDSADWIKDHAHGTVSAYDHGVVLAD